MTKPIILKKDKPQEEQVECEVNQYKYNNQSDSFYCSQNNVSGWKRSSINPHSLPFQDDDARCTDEEDGDLNNGGDIAQMGANFIGENLIEAPEAVSWNQTASVLNYRKFVADTEKLHSVCETGQEDGYEEAQSSRLDEHHGWKSRSCSSRRGNSAVKYCLGVF